MKIKSVFGMEPHRDGEIPDGASVGYNGVTRIDERLENMGSYGINWFDVYKGDVLAQKFNALGIASVIYFEEGE